MDKFAKAVGAAQGGVISVAMISAIAAGALALMPDSAKESIPWWGYGLIFLVAAIISIGAPFATTWLAPANKPEDLPTVVDIPVNVPVAIDENMKPAVQKSTPKKGA